MVLMQKPSVVDSPFGRAPTKAPRWDLADTEGYSGGNCVFLALWMFSGYVGIYRRKKYVGGRPRGPGDRGRALQGWVRPPISWPPRLLLDLHSKSSGSRSFQKSRSRRFHPFGLRLIFLFFELLKQAKKTTIWAGPPVSRLVPKMILPLFLIIVRIDCVSLINECAGHCTLDENAHPLPHVTHHPTCMLLRE